MLDQEFSADRLAELADGAALQVPWRLWEQSLYAPLREFLRRPGKEFRGALVEACFRLAGSRDPVPPALPLAVEALHAGSLIIDDIEDGATERRGAPALHRLTGVPTALNAGNWLYFWPMRLLDDVPLAPGARETATRLVNRTLLECHYGQALDLNATLSDLARGEVLGVVRAITELKTGSLMGLAAALGAVAGGAPDARVAAAARFGRDLGAALQMADDLSGLLSERRIHKGHEDLVNGTPTWAWAWLSVSLDARSFEALVDLLRGVRAGDPPEPLAARMRKLLAPHGRRRIHLALEQSLTRFAEAAPGASLGALRREIERLERSYV
ncbi:MAG: polyprenyl synthetase family protein [Deltaproteobacteria bacterium]|nr:polyprenyl synthetase family protein [Deltaproteobacteria bacterium]